MLATLKQLNLSQVHPSWQPCLTTALTKMDPGYLEKLQETSDWLPGHDKIFNAFNLPVSKVNYVLLGESPYPREASANGYAFWDAAVHDLWTNTGLSKPVNRATSLRNIIKMLLVANGMLQQNQTSQAEIAALDKTHLIKNNDELFENLIKHGFLLLNATLVLRPASVKKDALTWQPFTKHVLEFLLQKNPHIKLILLGQIANVVDGLLDLPHVPKLYAEHPYNLSFIQNKEVLDFFRPLHLLAIPQ